MWLKSLNLVGFKSFADRTHLEFRPGITVIVGPNGTGKSNLVDAIAWVLGTQSARNIRTEKMEQVIFAGTATRPGKKRAEVKILFEPDPPEGMETPTEIEITRRLFSDGSSDYELNGVSCRLIDITELLSDMGVGKQQHVIVGQGQIEHVLSASPEDHRQIIEEAAGILKHKLRQRRAQRRLDLAETDVARLTDLLDEIGRQMRPLRRQARSAERRELLVAELRALRLYQAGQVLTEMNTRIAQIGQQQERHSDRQSELSHQIKALQQEQSQYSHQRDKIAALLETDTASAAKLETTIERLRRIISVASERKRLAQTQLAGAGERRSDWQTELNDLKVSLEELATEISETHHQVAVTQTAYRSWEQADQAYQASQHGRGEGEEAALAAELAAGEKSLGRDRSERQSLAERVEWVQSQIDSQQKTSAEIAENIPNISEELNQAKTERDQNQLRLSQITHEIKQTQTNINGNQQQQLRLQTKLEAIRPQITIDQETITPNWATGRLIDQFSSPKEWEQALRAVLANWIGAWVLGSEEEPSSNWKRVLAEMEELRKDGGYIAHHKYQREDPIATNTEVRELGLVPLADKINITSPELAGWLAGVVVATNIEEGIKVIEVHPQLIAVTPNGDLVSARGLSISTTSDQIAEIENTITQITKNLAELNQKLEQQLSNQEQLTSRLAHNQSQISELNDKIEQLDRSRRSSETISRELSAELERLTVRLDDLDRVLAERSKQLSKIRDRFDKIDANVSSETGDDLYSVENQSQHVQEGQKLLSAWQTTQRKLAGLEERRTLSQTRQKYIRQMLEAQPDLTNIPNQISRLEHIQNQGHTLRQASQIELELLREAQHKLREELNLVAASLAKTNKELSQSELELANTNTELSELVLEQTELSVRKTGVIENLARDTDAEEKQALTAPRPDELEADIDLDALIATRAAQLKRMGPVNPLAAEEYQNLSERHRFLSTQLDDVERSRTELKKVIAALEDEIGNLFISAFGEVEQVFAEHFSTLFPGGKGRLRLSDPEAPLTSGVEIEAQPLGKRVKQLSLLSGGERSLAAIAFLFAVYGFRTSPFYVLDEVDAALDDTNIARFLRLLEGFRDQTQLIVVTHQQRTVSAADILYGITMEPGGSSQVISQPLSERAQAQTMLELV